jgi:hypothetical protein
MKRILLISLAAVLIAGFAGCGKAVYRDTAEQWLGSLGGKTKYDVSGAWEVPSGYSYSYWGGVYRTGPEVFVLVQEGSKITGNFNEYELIGRISGDGVFLVGLYDNVVYYTWHMRYAAKAKSLIGKQCDGYYPTVESHCYPLTLTKAK